MRHLLFLLALILLCPRPVMAQGKEASWDVNHPLGKVLDVPIDVTQGTWLSLDVSPDGKTIVFDLLGDLYLLDIAGGEARAVTSGMAWDMQPTFSPDGSQLAFTSDRGGGDNLWVLTLNTKDKGTAAKAITSEKFRLLNSPAWDPVGPYLAGRKHFTGTRSLGAGEIWAYHLEGGDGLQATKRANEQLDLGEPAYSADGRYLYYSLDATPGPTFQYNKDPNSGIYAIERLDRSSGKIERIAGGAGGACRPTPSPDGRTLAFVRRIRGKSVLMNKDLESGKETELYTGLDRDMQETWAIHGVYPRIAWTPDSQELVFWAQGHLWRLGAQPGQTPRQIPFQVKGTRQVQQALRFPVPVAPPQIPIKAIRSPQLSPDGNTLVFEALGKLWIQEGQSPPKRLTSSNQDHESHPKWSDSGLLYVSWNDQNLGSIRLRNLAAGTEKMLTEKGRFADPVLSPDGQTLVYRRLGSDSLFPPLYTQGRGLYVQTGDQQPRLLDTSGREAHFGKDSNVLYFDRSGESTQLVRHDLTTGQERVLVEGKDIQAIQLSADEKQAFFLQNLQLYTVPMTLTGRTIEIGAGVKNLPTRKVSTSQGAYFPAWNARGVLSWNVGPQLFQWTAGKTPAPRDLSWNVPAFKATGTVALVGGRVVSMRGQEVIPDGTVVIQGDRISAVGPRAEVAVPQGATILDCSGKTVLPGLIDVHWHGSFSDGEGFPQTNWVGLSSLSFGVTTLHDPSNDTASVFSAKEMQQARQLLAPRIFSTGTILYGAKAPGYFAAVDSLADAQGHLKRLKTWGAISVKSYNQPRREQRQQILEAAREQRMMVVPEGGSTLAHNLSMVIDGHTGLEHALPTAEIYDDVVQLWSATQVGYTPTLGVAYGGQWGENYWYVETDVWEDERLNRFVPREVIDPDARHRIRVPDDEHNHINAARVANKLSQAGVKVNLGAHGQREGLAAHWELWMLVQGGMTPHQALACATINGARYLGMDADIGSLEPGKLADVIVIDGDPLTDIRQSKRIEWTVLGGRVYESASMKETAPVPGPEPKLWWRQ